MFQIFVMFILARLLLANPSTVASVAQLSKRFMQSSNFRNSMLGDHAILFSPFLRAEIALSQLILVVFKNLIYYLNYLKYLVLLKHMKYDFLKRVSSAFLEYHRTTNLVTLP